ncbi:hypothetical protein [Orf virus]|nr:hypothetical protein [Orf virus]
MSFQRGNRSIRPAMSEALQNDFSYNPRPPPPSAEEIDFFCVDMRKVLMEIEAKPWSSRHAERSTLRFAAPATTPTHPSARWTPRPHPRSPSPRPWRSRHRTRSCSCRKAATCTWTRAWTRSSA